MTAQQVKNVFQDVGGHGSLSTIKRSLHGHNLRGFTTMQTPQKQKGQAAVQKKIRILEQSSME